VAGGLSFRRVAAGGHTCAETPTDRAYCWGSNAFGQLGDDTSISRQKPVPGAGGLSFAQLTVSISRGHSCGKTTSGLGYCWGYGEMGQLGTDPQSDPSKPAPVLGPM